MRFTDTPTKRGFSRYEFRDGNDVPCSLQKSSVATGDLIWLGCNDIGLKKFTPDKGWEDINTEGDRNPGGIAFVANTRMHLTREQVAALLPILELFVKTGEISQ